MRKGWDVESAGPQPA